VPQILNYSDLTNSDSQVQSQAKINNELDHVCLCACIRVTLMEGLSLNFTFHIVTEIC